MDIVTAINIAIAIPTSITMVMAMGMGMETMRMGIMIMLNRSQDCYPESNPFSKNKDFCLIF